MVLYSDTVSDPRTMMVHSHNTFITERAMMSTRRLDFFASFTVLINEHSFNVMSISKFSFTGAFLNNNFFNRNMSRSKSTSI